MSSDTAYLLAIAIGPVQDFIAASRKARDLWYGSHLLSLLSREAATSLRDQAELIFPASASLAEGHAVANKLLVIVRSPRDPQQVAEAARVAVQSRLEQEWNNVLSGIRDLPAGPLDADLAGEQMEDFVEWYAAWVPYDPGAAPDAATGYKQARTRVERLLAGRKALREFRPAAGRDMRPKSSLDPSRESVVDLAADVDGRWARRLRLKGSEQLDGISLIKRMNGQRDGQSRFVSTARVAIDPFIRAAATASDTSLELLEKLAEQAKILAKTDVAEGFATDAESGLGHYALFPFDSQLFYEPNPESIQAQLLPWADERDSKELSDAGAEFFKLVQCLRHELAGMGELPAYLAVLRADGDHMGVALGKLDEAVHHAAFSAQLGAFAEQAGVIVRAHFGAMIYSGGDDVLAFLPLDTALPCADALRQVFNDTMIAALAPYPKVAKPTLSVGIAIGHFSEHLQRLLARAHDAELAAKGPRNALAVSFAARSGGGSARTVVHSWDDEPVTAFWKTAIDLHRHEAFPDGAVYELDGLRRELHDSIAADVFAADEIDGLVIPEVLRILKRKRAKQGTERVADPVVKQIQTRLDAGSNGGTSALDALESLVSELAITRRLYRLLPASAREARARWDEAVNRKASSDETLARADESEVAP